MSESGKVVVTKTKLDELANRINEKAGSTGPKTIAELTQTVANMPAGVIPEIGANGNWYINGADTGKPSRGEIGPQGAEGPNTVSETTTTALEGILKGDGAHVTTAVPGVDYAQAPFTIMFTRKKTGLGHYTVVSSKTGEQIVAAFNAGLRVIASLNGMQLDVSTVNGQGGYDFVHIDADGIIAGVRLKITDAADMDTGETVKNYSFAEIQYQCMNGPNSASISPNVLWGTDANGIWTMVSSITLKNFPAVSASDNGKFLRVVNGAWAIAAIDNANGGSF